MEILMYAMRVMNLSSSAGQSFRGWLLTSLS